MHLFALRGTSCTNFIHQQLVCRVAQSCFRLYKQLKLSPQPLIIKCVLHIHSVGRLFFLRLLFSSCGELLCPLVLRQKEALSPISRNHNDAVGIAISALRLTAFRGDRWGRRFLTLRRRPGWPLLQGLLFQPFLPLSRAHHLPRNERRTGTQRGREAGDAIRLQPLQYEDVRARPRHVVDDFLARGEEQARLQLDLGINLDRELYVGVRFALFSYVNIRHDGSVERVIELVQEMHDLFEEILHVHEIERSPQVPRAPPAGAVQVQVRFLISGALR
mmetsp:Transcript_13769/g.23279  ORF Transcript_13769/g.23279 Transcript_13769/m.23279 type:complete len:275 (-) Transcript_13769:721-1545(-)